MPWIDLWLEQVEPTAHQLTRQHEASRPGHAPIWCARLAAQSSRGSGSIRAPPLYVLLHRGGFRGAAHGMKAELKELACHA